MTASISRDEAIALLCRADLKKLTTEERAEELDIMACENWASHSRWLTIAADVRDEIENRKDIRHPEDSRYDDALCLVLSGNYSNARNDYLTSCLARIGQGDTEVTGDEPQLIACPCCGACSLDSRGDYDICKVCWWEDDGQDNDDANSTLGGSSISISGPNYGISLIRARINFLTVGIYDPRRDDLRKSQDPVEKYNQGRVFVLSPDGQSVSEPAANWQGSLSEERS